MKKLWNNLDGLICKYIGIVDEEITPYNLKEIGGHLLISNTGSFKRHLHVQKLDDFFTTGFKKLNSLNKQKLGKAIGTALAKDLVVSFDNIDIKRDKFNA